MSLNGGVFLPSALYAPFFTLSGLMRKAQEKKQFFHAWNAVHCHIEITESNSIANLYCIIAWWSGLLIRHKNNGVWMKREDLQ